jgi:hypothetical protein
VGAVVSERTVRLAPLRAGAGLDLLVKRHAVKRSRTAKIAAGLVMTAALAALAHVAGTDVRAGFGAGPTDLTQQLVRLLMSRGPTLD